MADTWKFFSDDFGKNLGKVNVGWQFDKTAKKGFDTGDGARYIPSTETIYLDGKQNVFPARDDDTNERWTIIHEYGHFAMYTTFGTVSSSESACSGHKWSNAPGEICAWKEGWSGILPSLVDNKASYPRDQQLNILFEEDKFQFRSDSSKVDFPKTENSIDVGQKSEGQVASAIWDIYDTPVSRTFDYDNGGSDDLSEGYTEIGVIFKEKPQTFEQFYDKWQKRYTTKDATNVMKLHYMNFVANEPPVLSSIGNKIIDQGDRLKITPSATDPDGDSLTYSLTGKPSGAIFSTSSGIFNWTPGSSQVGTHYITITVSDGTLSDFERIRITVTAQEGPEIDNIRNKRLAEGTSTTTNVSATDVNGDRITLRLLTDPDYNTPVPNWITLTDNGNGNGVVNVDAPSEVPLDRYDLRVTATDNDGTDHDDFRIYISEVNQDPILSSIDSKSVREKSNLSFTVSATDADLPSQTLSYSITNTPPQQPSDVPDNISLNTSTGEFSWTPTSRQTGFHSYVSTVSDGTSTDSEIVSITVSAIPNSSPKKTHTPTSSSISSNSVTVSWTAPSSGSGPITGYDIFRSASPKVLIASVPSTQLSYTDDTVLPSTTYSYTISAKNQFGSGDESEPIIVSTTSDETAPIIIVPDNYSTEATAVYTPLTKSDYGTATATDNVDPNPIITNNATATFSLGDTAIEWTATDESGNSASDIQIVTLVDTTIPIIILNGDSTVTIPFGSTYTDNGARAGDNIDDNITSKILTVNPVDTSIPGDYTVTYNVVDSSNNPAVEVTRTVTVLSPPDLVTSGVIEISTLRDSWDISKNGGSGWKFYEPRNVYTTSFGWDVKSQTVSIPDDLKVAMLEVNSSVEITVSEQYSKSYCGDEALPFNTNDPPVDQYFMNISLLDSTGNELYDYSSGNLVAPGACEWTNIWNEMNKVITVSDIVNVENIESIKIEHGGVSGEWWKGHYGPVMKDLTVTWTS